MSHNRKNLWIYSIRLKMGLKTLYLKKFYNFSFIFKAKSPKKHLIFLLTKESNIFKTIKTISKMLFYFKSFRLL